MERPNRMCVHGVRRFTLRAGNRRRRLRRDCQHAARKQRQRKCQRDERPALRFFERSNIE